MPLDPQLKDLLDFLANSRYPALNEGTPETGRIGFRAMSCDLVNDENRVPVDSVRDLEVPGAAGALGARLYRPAQGELPTVVFFHGGGFVLGDLDTHDQTCRRLANDTGAAVLSVDYRLAPEHPFPAATEDAEAATRWATAHLAELGGGAVLAVAGDSAGGNLAAVVAQRVPGIAAQLLIYPATDALADNESTRANGEGYFLTNAMRFWFGGHYAGGVPDLDPNDPRLSPVRAASLAGGPPAVVATAEFDPLRDEGEEYADALAAAGVPVDRVRYDGMIHGFVDMVGVSEAAARAVADLNRRFARLLSDRA